MRDLDFVKVARDIEHEGQMRALGRELCFEKSDLDKFEAANRSTGRVSFGGIKEMLLEWRRGVRPAEQPAELKMALLRAGMIHLADKFFSNVQCLEGIIKILYFQKIKRSNIY